MYPIIKSPLREIYEYIGIYYGVWGLGFRVEVPNNLGTWDVGNSSYSTGFW